MIEIFFWTSHTDFTLKLDTVPYVQYTTFNISSAKVKLNPVIKINIWIKNIKIINTTSTLLLIRFILYIWKDFATQFLWMGVRFCLGMRFIKHESLLSSSKCIMWMQNWKKSILVQLSSTFQVKPQISAKTRKIQTIRLRMVDPSVWGGILRSYYF